MIQSEIQAGICGFRTTVRARSDDSQNVSLDITSTCEKIQRLAADLGAIDAYQEFGEGFGGVIHTTVLRHLKGCCAGCVVPNGIFKTVQVAGGVALPAPCTIAIERRNEPRGVQREG